MTDIPLAKRAVITLFSDPADPNSHRIRFLGVEKEVPMEVVPVSADEVPEDLYELNPYGTIPTLVDRDLVLHDAQVILEYLDERFPHPPMMPIDPIQKAIIRQQLRLIETEWYPLVRTIASGKDKKAVTDARKQLFERLIQLIPIVSEKPYFLSDEFTLLDLSMAPIFWRLQYLGIELPRSAKPVMDYGERLLSRPEFKNSLTDDELDMRDIL
ncbi:glutathione S-transferase N-terminal domain-containing protein [Sulfurivirga sp.]|uniref:glutathione S-transferase N-terminal domain-containing protein n=1 Tax=Sulfurivirga sp. TaxID=2614236 RepID=UPI0025FC27F1|nr:glutathione S-transferase N-terminal domain-containing protein [Sulfurivirga sp.]